MFLCEQRHCAASASNTHLIYATELSLPLSKALRRHITRVARELLRRFPTVVLQRDKAPLQRLSLLEQLQRSTTTSQGSSLSPRMHGMCDGERTGTAADVDDATARRPVTAA